MKKGKPKAGGLSDPRMRTVDCKIKCQTCGWQSAQATLVTLRQAHVPYWLYEDCTVLSIMRCVCFKYCSKILVDEDNTKFKQALKIRYPKNRMKRIYDACKTKKVCGDSDDLDV